MASQVVIRMKHFACIEDFDEQKYGVHITNKHGFDSRLQIEYIVKLEGQIKALEERIKVLERKSSRYP